ncbi:MAG: hypothetical protein OQK35_05770, partial [Alphaproteobacteria bacterium]|nr:hypothetical protein [Alphaproteobacteria bacterium]
MGRIADLASNQTVVNLLQATQSRLYDAQYQVSTEKRSPDYAGISRESQRLLNLENTNERILRYSRNNDVMNMRLEVQHETNNAIEKVIGDFREQLDNFIQGDVTNEAAVDEIQDFAYKSLVNIEAFLDTRIDGQYLYAGSRTDTMPVDFPWTSQADFQTMYDGSTTTYPTTRTAHLEQRLTNADIGAVSFNAAGTISADAAVGTEFANIGIGTKFTIAGANNSANDQTYTVTANTGSVLTVTPVPGATDAADAAFNLNAQSYYYGDDFARTHRLDDDRTMDNDVTAEHPAFEKAIRAMGIILQGQFGTAGGLDQNTARADDAHYLLGIALEEPQDGTPPYGAETIGNMEEL